MTSAQPLAAGWASPVGAAGPSNAGDSFRAAEMELKHKDAIVSCLRRGHQSASVLEVSHATGLGTIVVIPALQALLDEGTVQRRIMASSPRPRSEFNLTSAGRRRIAG